MVKEEEVEAYVCSWDAFMKVDADSGGSDVGTVDEPLVGTPLVGTSPEDIPAGTAADGTMI